jgi:hypothetical protein
MSAVHRAMTIWTLLGRALHEIVYYFGIDKVNRAKNRAPFPGNFARPLSFYRKRKVQGSAARTTDVHAKKQRQRVLVLYLYQKIFPPPVTCIKLVPPWFWCVIMTSRSTRGNLLQNG